MRVFHSLLLLLAALLTVPTAHAARSAPMATYENMVVASADGKPLSAEQVRKAIIAAGASKQWAASVQAPDTIRLTHTRGRHTAVVDVVYTTKSYSIRYVDSTDLNYGERDGGKAIHPTYNNWINNLRLAIDVALRAA